MIKMSVYLDVDVSGEDLLDSAGNPISAGWYVYSWPLGEPLEGPNGDRLLSTTTD